MSTYEALIDMYESLGRELRALLKDVEKFEKTSELTLDLVELDAAMLSGTHMQRLVVGRRRMAAGRDLAQSAMRDAADHLQSLGRFTLQSEVAAGMGDSVTARNASKMADDAVAAANRELEGAFSLVEMIRKTLAESGIPKLFIC